MEVSINGGTPKSSIFNDIVYYKPAYFGIPIYGETSIFLDAQSNFYHQEPPSSAVELRICCTKMQQLDPFLLIFRGPRV